MVGIFLLYFYVSIKSILFLFFNLGLDFWISFDGLLLLLGSEVFSSRTSRERYMFRCFYWWNIGNLSFGTTGICHYMHFYYLITWTWTLYSQILYCDTNRLSWFQDYHRFHSPVSGTVEQFVNIPGCLYTVCDCRYEIFSLLFRCFCYAPNVFPFSLFRLTL